MKLVIAFLLSTVTCALAQDVIIKKDDTKMDVKIIEINKKEIRYKKFSNPEGPDYTMDKDDAVEVRYQNGEIESLSKAPSVQSKEFGKHYLSYNAFALLFSNINFSYEYFFPSGNFSVKFPVTLGFSNERLEASFNNDNNIVKVGRNKKFSVAVDFNFYPTGQGRAKYFLGTGIEYGQYDYLKNIYSFDSSLLSIRDYNQSTANYMAITFKNGLLFQPTQNFNIQLTGGLGMARDYAEYEYFSTGNTNNSNPRIYEDHYFLYASGALNIGVRF